MNDVILLIVFALGSYFFGNINWAVIISKIKKVDIRKMGSGNPGTLNMSRNLGLKAGLLTFFLDITKGATPTLIAYFVFKDKLFVNTEFHISDFAVYLCGLCVVLGHIYPIVFKIKEQDFGKYYDDLKNINNAFFHNYYCHINNAYKTIREYRNKVEVETFDKETDAIYWCSDFDITKEQILSNDIRPFNLNEKVYNYDF